MIWIVFMPRCKSLHRGLHPREVKSHEYIVFEQVAGKVGLCMLCAVEAVENLYILVVDKGLNIPAGHGVRAGVGDVSSVP